ncbi:MAG: phosphopantothenoylcysteine decarboxylase [Planctomycetes bacterium]|nr:phosphopantothenoylcysteine decarboxylase [Planctomycetota bacterium]
MVSIMITAGPTREHLDDVRFLSNGSSGRMGCALAAAAAAAGHRVTLVLGPVEIAPPSGVAVRPVVSALEMMAAASECFGSADVAIAAAAVADWRPAVRAVGKPPRTGDRVLLELVPNPDIVASLAAVRGRRVVVGFALEATAAGLPAAIARGREKLRRKQLDLVVVNLHEAVGSASSDAVLCYADGREEALGRRDKDAAAARIVAAAVGLHREKQAP